MPREGRKRWNETDRSVEERKALSVVERTPPSDPHATNKNDAGSGEKTYPQQMDDLEEQVNKAIPQRYDNGRMQVPTIYVVPRDLADGNIQAYVPTVVCIGPFFYSHRETTSMLKLETYKWCCVRKLIVGKGTADHWVHKLHAPVLRKCLDAMMCLVPRIRASYSISTSMEYILAGRDRSDDEQATLMALLEKDEPEINEQLARMMLLDGCFVLHRILKYARLAKTNSGGSGTTRADVDEDDDDDWTQLFGRREIWAIATRDLLLLNNQIPFFVLRELFELLKGSVDEHDDVLIDGGLQLFRWLHPPRASGTPPRISCCQVHHLLHLFYLSVTHLPPPKEEEEEPPSKNTNYGPLWVPSATELDNAGVKICARKDDSAVSFLDIAFRKRSGDLEIPPLELFDNSEPLFRNMVALEQTDLSTPGHVTAYAILMDCLVKTPEDMRLLSRSGVLVNHINGESDSVATGFFSRLCAHAYASRDTNYLAGVMGEVVRYQSGMWPRWRAELRHNYFTNPWVTISVVGAGLVIALTLLQSFYAVYAYYKPPK